MEVITIPSVVVKRIKREAERLGVSLEEYIVEILSQQLDPLDKAREYVESANELLKEAEEELAKNNIRQAAEKIWGATALAIKAYAYWKDNKRLSSHKELWEYKDRVARDLGDWVRAAFQRAGSLHVCFYEGWCTRHDVEDIHNTIGKLVKSVMEKISGKGK